MLLTAADGRLSGFCIKGHSGAGVSGHDLVCAAVSSASLMTVNAVTDVCRAHAVVRESDGRLFLSVLSGDLAACQTLLEGFRLHMRVLAAQYPAYIRVSEIQP